MHKVNTAQIVEVTWSSPKGKFIGAGKEVSEELGRKPESTDLNERQAAAASATKMGLLRLRLAMHLFSSRVSHTRSPMTLQKT